MRNNPSIYSLKSRLNRGYLKSRNARLLFFVGQTLCIIDIGTSEVGKRCVSHAVVAWVSVIYFLKGRVYCMAIKSFTDTYKIKGSDIDRFCRIMSDTKKIKIQTTNDHHDLKDVEEYRKLFGFVKK